MDELNKTTNDYEWSGYSSYWLDDETYNKVVSGRALNIPIADLISKHKIIKNIRNFVDIINNEGSSKIEVIFAGQQARTDGKTLQVSSDVEDFDLLAGLSLHESSHIQYSKDHFRILAKMESASRNIGILHKHQYSDNEYKFVKVLFDYLKKFNINNIIVPVNYFCLVGNFIEDARVDEKVISKYPGYKPYYDALIKKYVGSDEAMKRLNELEGETWKNYLAKMLLLTLPNPDLTVLKGLKEISDTIDVDNINRLKGGLDVFKLTFEIFKIIEKYVEQAKQEKQQEQSSGDGESESQEKNDKPESNDSKNNNPGESMPDADMDNMDGNSDDKTPDSQNNTSGSGDSDEPDDSENKDNSTKKSNDEDTDPDETENDTPGKNDNSDEKESDDNKDGDVEETTDKDFELDFNSDEMKKVIDAINNIHEKEEMGESEQDALEMITNKSILTRSVDYPDTRTGEAHVVDTILIKDITNKALLKKFEMINLLSRSMGSKRAVDNGIKAGKLLASRLAIMNDVKCTDHIRQESGNLDQRLLPEFGHGNRKIFKTQTYGKYQDTYIHITIDNSGSMNGQEFRDAMHMGTMFAVASLYVKGLMVQVSVRSTTRTIIGVNTPYVAIIFDSYENHDIKHIKEYFPQIHPTGLTPEGLTFAIIKDYIKECSRAKNSIFINISDGGPNCYINDIGDMFEDDSAVEFTTKQVKEIIKAGIKVISFYVGNGGEDDDWVQDFKKMYGKYSYFTDVIKPLKVANIFNKELRKI